MQLAGNPNLADVVRIARQVGVSVEVRKGTGELRFAHPSFGFIMVNGRRKDTPRSILVPLRRLVKGV
jgi:hypothetical protein